MFCEIGPETGSYTSGGGLDVGAFHVLGLGYIFNFLGVFLDVFFSIFTGVPATDMNPVMGRPR